LGGGSREGERNMAAWRTMLFQSSSIVAALRAAAPQTRVVFDDGRYPGAAAATARTADVAIVFANQWMTESEDAPSLDLPEGQDALIEAVTAANPRTIVVLQTGGAVAMPWLGKTAGVVEAWYSGAQGASAIAAVLFGDVDPSGRLPVTFPASIAQYPRADIPGWDLAPTVQFDVPHPEGSDVGYRRFAATGQKPLFPFGYGLSYTSFRYANLKVTGGETVKVSFSVTNTGTRAGKEAPQAYLAAIADKPLARLIGFDKISLEPGETKQVEMTADPRLLARFDEAGDRWVIAGGDYRVVVGPSSADPALAGHATIDARTLKP
jgi:beta-glucosidase